MDINQAAVEIPKGILFKKVNDEQNRRELEELVNLKGMRFPDARIFTIHPKEGKGIMGGYSLNPQNGNFFLHLMPLNGFDTVGMFFRMLGHASLVGEQTMGIDNIFVEVPEDSSAALAARLASYYPVSKQAQMITYRYDCRMDYERPSMNLQLLVIGLNIPLNNWNAFGPVSCAWVQFKEDGEPPPEWAIDIIHWYFSKSCISPQEPLSVAIDLNAISTIVPREERGKNGMITYPGQTIYYRRRGTRTHFAVMRPSKGKLSVCFYFYAP